MSRRVSVRLAMESVAESVARDKVFLWLAWLADSPADACDLFSKVAADPRLVEIAQAASLWMVYLKSPEAAFALLNGRSTAPSPALQQFLASCPSCHAQLAVRSSALGNRRTCPGCATEFQIPTSLPTYQEPSQLGQVDIYIPAKVCSAESPPTSNTILLIDDSPTVRAVAAK